MPLLLCPERGGACLLLGLAFSRGRAPVNPKGTSLSCGNCLQVPAVLRGSSAMG